MSPQDMADKQPRELLTDPQKLIGLISFLTLIFAVIHEWAFFTVVGLPFLTLASPIDYVSSAIYWLPLGIGAVIAMFTIHKTVPSLFRHSRQKILHFYFYSGVFILLSTLIVRSFTAPKMASAVLLCILLLFIALCVFSFRNRSIEENSYLYSLTLLISTVYVIGLGDAHPERTNEKSYSLLIKGTPEKTVFVLRNFEKGVLVEHVDTGTVGFYPWSEVNGILEIGKGTSPPTIACALLKRFCR
jgi:hypothetical protein